MALSNPFAGRYIKAADGTVDIKYGRKECHLEMQRIRKMYIRHKSGYWARIAQQVLAAQHGYELHIALDEGEICFPVKPHERQDFIGFISWLRNQRGV
jgi:hypothetical protein